MKFYHLIKTFSKMIKKTLKYILVFLLLYKVQA